MADHHATVEVPTAAAGGSSQDIPEEMMAELKKEIARNVEATKLVKQREIEATFARDRAADSQRRMQEMMNKYEEMKKKLEWTRLTLAETHSRLEQHNSARSERIRQSVTQLKEKADICTQKLNQRSAAQQAGGTGGEDGQEDDTPSPFPSLVAPSSEDAGGLTDAERMLLQLCQEQLVKDQAVTDDVITDDVTDQVTDESEAAVNENAVVVEPTNALDDVIVAEPPKPVKPAKDYAKTVLDLQMKLSSGGKLQPAAKPEVDKPEVTCVPEVAKPEVATDSNAAAVAAPSTQDHEVLKEVANEIVETGAAADEEDAAKKEVVKNVEAVVETVEAVTMDLNETVSQMHAKCASVREELGQMAMSEQYMRTKQAQLLAKTREREAQLAMELAAEKEREAEAMRRKVTDMMKLLEERRNKLKMTEVVLEKKSVVVEKVNKILDSKERRANYVEKQHAECLAFDKKQTKKTD